MKIARLSVQNPQITLVGLALMAALGANAFGAIPRAEDPSFPIPTFVVVAVQPGASPRDLEQLVGEPIEDALRELDDVDEVVTTARAGVISVRVDFLAGVDTDEKYADVMREVDRVRPDLPQDLVRLDVDRVRTSNVGIAQIAIVGDAAPLASLEREAERLERALDAVPGVRRADVWAVPEREVRVELDTARAAALGVTTDRVLGALSGDNVTVPGGAVDVGEGTFGVVTGARFRTLEDVRATVVATTGTATVRLGDVARVRFSHEDETHVGRFGGERAAFVTAQLADGHNVLTVRERIDAAIARVARDVPEGVRIERGFDQATNVERRLDRLYEDFLVAILLVLVTLLPLGFRASLVVMMSIPLSLALGLAAIHAMGYSLNQLSIVGFVIALGLLVDDSIVVVENITRFLREGHGRKEAAIAASSQIGAAVLGCTATLVFAFVPLLFLPGGAGDYIRSLPVAVIATVLASLVVALTVTPWLASLLLPRTGDAHGNVVLRALDRVIEASYGRVLTRALAHPKATLLVSALLVAAAGALVPVVGFSLFPKAGTPQFLVRVETPEGAGLPATDRAVRHVESVLAQHARDVRFVFASVGRGNPQVYYNVPSRPEDPRYGEVFAELVRVDPKTSPALFESMRQALRRYPGARIELVEFQNGPPLEAPIAVRVVADDLEGLARAATQVAEALEATPGTRDVDNPLRLAHSELAVRVDRVRAGMLGVPVAQAARAVRLALAGLEVGALRDDAGDEHTIRVVRAHGERPGIDALDHVFVTSLAGRSVPLRQVVTIDFDRSTPLVQRRNGERIAMVQAQVTHGANVERVTQAVEARFAGLTLPSGARLEIAGERESRSESFGGLGGAILIAVFGVLAILVLEFRTFRSTLIVATVIPLGFVGGVTFLFLAGYSLSFVAVIGFVALVGIEIKNSILLVDATNQLRQEGMALDDAIVRAGEIRFLPIVLTTATAIGGLAPLAYQGAPLYAPLAVVIIGGLVSSTLLARIVTPVAYKLLPPEVRVTDIPLQADAHGHFDDMPALGRASVG